MFNSIFCSLLKRMENNIDAILFQLFVIFIIADCDNNFAFVIMAFQSLDHIMAWVFMC